MAVGQLCLDRRIMKVSLYIYIYQYMIDVYMYMFFNLDTYIYIYTYYLHEKNPHYPSMGKSIKNHQSAMVFFEAVESLDPS